MLADNCMKIIEKVFQGERTVSANALRQGCALWTGAAVAEAE